MGATILVADDEPAIVELLAELLSAEGYRVLTAFDGRAALASLERERPDLLLTDQRMPHLSGTELIARLHARPDLAVPTILMSSAAPVPGPPPPAVFFPKPFDLDRLLGLVVEMLHTATP
jgi:CheY-like chemotaxis protein